MKTVLKSILSIATLSVWALFATMQAAECVATLTPIQTQQCATIDISKVDISDLFSEVVCSNPSTNNVNINHRSTSSNIGTSLLYSSIAIKDKHSESSHNVTNSELNNIAIASKPQSLYYIYALHRIRV